MDEGAGGRQGWMLGSQIFVVLGSILSSRKPLLKRGGSLHFMKIIMAAFREKVGT